MSDIPKARKMLSVVNERLRALRVELYSIERLLKREPPIRRSPPRNRLTRGQIVLIRRLFNKGLTHDEIAKHAGTNIGRVSEVVRGLR